MIRHYTVEIDRKAENVWRQVQVFPVTGKIESLDELISKGLEDGKYLMRVMISVHIVESEVDGQIKSSIDMANEACSPF